MNYEMDKKTCAACRNVLKVDLAYLMLGLEPIYLSEINRNKKGRPRKISKADERADINYRHDAGVSMSTLAKEYGVAKSIIHRSVQKK